MVREKAIWPAFFCIVFVLLTVSAARPLTSLYASHLHASLLEIGLLTACYSLLPLVFAIQAGRLTDRLGAKLPILAASLGMSLSMLLPFLYPSLFSLLISQLLLGISQLFAVVALQNAIASHSDKDQRDRVISNFSLLASLGMFLGPLIGGYASDHFSYRTAFFILAGSPLLSLLVAGFMKREKKPAVSKHIPSSRGTFSTLKEVLSTPDLRSAILISMLILASLDIFNVYFPLFASSIGMNSAQIGWLLSTQAMASMAVRLCMGHIIHRMGRVRVLWVFILIGAVAFAMLPFMSRFWMLIIMTGILGFGLGIVQPLTITMTYNAAPKGRTGEILGTRLAGNRLSQIVFPVVLAAASNFAGIGFIFLFQGMLLLGGVWLAREMELKDKAAKDILA